jgi:hypothetical protein
MARTLLHINSKWRLFHCFSLTASTSCLLFFNCSYLSLYIHTCITHIKAFCVKSPLRIDTLTMSHYTVCPTRYRTRHFFNNFTVSQQLRTLQTHSCSFLTQRTYPCSNFVAIPALVLELLKKCRVR